MIFLSYNAQQDITLPIRDWKYGNDDLTNYGDYWRIQAKFVNKDTREVITYTLVSPSFLVGVADNPITYLKEIPNIA